MESESGCFGEVLFLMVRQFIGITRRSNGKLVVEVTPPPTLKIGRFFRVLPTVFGLIESS